ncbi:hypothetical protein KU306_13575 [Haloferax larsenii]|uniref:DUF7999 domain-containing protein n=2 Tax=Haloferax larsenii TaxID=302484 RepID=A0ABY5RC44_HALLR|nr:hypothetical protein [Haloferax larsenii]UVE49934.1 hypothetical protein KU306_13575 [Haloferax larsenii]
MKHGGGSKPGERAETRRVRVEREMNDHRAMTVRLVDSGECRTLVGYGSPGVRRALERTAAGETVTLTLAPTPGRGNTWLALDC